MDKFKQKQKQTIMKHLIMMLLIGSFAQAQVFTHIEINSTSANMTIAPVTGENTIGTAVSYSIVSGSTFDLEEIPSTFQGGGSGGLDREGYYTYSNGGRVYVVETDQGFGDPRNRTTYITRTANGDYWLAGDTPQNLQQITLAEVMRHLVNNIYR